MNSNAQALISPALINYLRKDEDARMGLFRDMVRSDIEGSLDAFCDLWETLANDFHPLTRTEHAAQIASKWFQANNLSQANHVTPKEQNRFAKLLSNEIGVAKDAEEEQLTTLFNTVQKAAYEEEGTQIIIEAGLYYHNQLSHTSVKNFSQAQKAHTRIFQNRSPLHFERLLAAGLPPEPKALTEVALVAPHKLPNLIKYVPEAQRPTFIVNLLKQPIDSAAFNQYTLQNLFNNIDKLKLVVEEETYAGVFNFLLEREDARPYYPPKLLSSYKHWLHSKIQDKEPMLKQLKKLKPNLSQHALIKLLELPDSSEEPEL